MFDLFLTDKRKIIFSKGILGKLERMRYVAKTN